MTTFYVVSTATGTADGSSEADAFTTIDAAMNAITTAGAGPHKVWVKATATYDETANIDTAGTITAPVIFEGYSTTTGDNGKVTWTKSTSGNCLTDTPSLVYYVFKNFIFTSCATNNVVIAGALSFVNCEFLSASAYGVSVSGNYVSFLNCVIANNSNDGCNNALGQYPYFIGCKVYGNTSEGIVAQGISGFIYKSLIYNNGSTVAAVVGCDNMIVADCTIDGDGTTGALLDGNSEAFGAIVNNILYDGATAYLTNDTTGIPFFACVTGYNLINSCTNGYYDGTNPLNSDVYGWQGVTSAPAFTNEAGDDYTLGATSPAIDAGCTPGGIT